MSGSVHPTVKPFAEKAGQHEPLYITEYSVTQDFDFPAGFRVDGFPGLLFCQVIVNEEKERRVIAWWKSKETFAQAWGEQFEQVLGKQGAISFEGFQLVHCVKSDPVGWLRPTAIIAAVGALVALLTGLSTLQDWGYSLLATPDCTLWTDPVAAAKPVAVGEPFAIQVQIKNRHLRASEDATIDTIFFAEELERTDGAKPYPVRIEPGKAEVQEFRFTALRGGKHTITFGGKQKSGYVQPTREIPPITITINAWDAIDRSPEVSLLKSNERSASLSVDVRHARPTPYGTTFEATLTDPAEVDVRPDKVTIKDSGDSLRNVDFAQLRWRIPPSTEVLKIQRCRIVLQEAGAKTRSEAEWKAMLQRLTVHADEPDELTFAEQTK